MIFGHFFVFWCLSIVSLTKAERQPNILFSIVESTEASAYFPNIPLSEIPLPIPTITKLMRNGVTFLNNYVAAPVCCPSRASIVSGRHIHKLGHYQTNPSTGLYVNGAWNNHEGLSSNYNKKFMNILSNNTFFNNSNNTNNTYSYNWKVFGKKDWNAGGHSLSCRVNSWCNKVNFPYTISTNESNNLGNEYMAGWYDESGPILKLIDSNNPYESCHQTDWKNLYKLIEWIKLQNKINPDKPWYCGYCVYCLGGVLCYNYNFIVFNKIGLDILVQVLYIHHIVHQHIG